MTLRNLRGTATRPLTALTALLVAVGLAAGCSATADDDSGSDPTASAPTTTGGDADPGDSTSTTADDSGDGGEADGGDDQAPEFSYEGRDGSTALDLLLEADPSAEVTGEGENAFVTAVDGVAADPDGEFWALYVNGDPATVGAGSLETKDGDEITWKLETFTS